MEPSEFVDYYEVLGVPPHATNQELGTAYRALLRQIYCTYSHDIKELTTYAQKYNEAYKVLGRGVDLDGARTAYDQQYKLFKFGSEETNSLSFLDGIVPPSQPSSANIIEERFGPWRSQERK